MWNQHCIKAKFAADSRLSGTRETEEQGNISLLSVWSGHGLVGARVQRELTELDRLQVVHNGEDTLLHFTGVLGTQDNHFHSLEVDFDRSSGSHTGSESVGRELSGVVDDEVGFAVVFELLRRWSDQHVVHEQGVVGSGSDDSDLDSVLRIPTGEAVKDVDVLTGVQVVDGSFTVDFKGVLVHGNVDTARPPDVVLRGLFVDDSLVLGRSTGLLAGEVDESTVGGDDGAFVHDGVLVQCGDGGVSLDVDLVHVETGLREVLDLLADDWKVSKDWSEPGCRAGATPTYTHCQRLQCLFVEACCKYMNLVVEV